MEELRRRFIFTIFTFLAFLFLGLTLDFYNSSAEPLLPEGMTIQEGYQTGPGLPVGKIQSVRGEVIIIHPDLLNGYRAKVGLPLYEGDTIITLEKGRINCKLSDGSLLTLAAGTKLAINRCFYNSAARRSISNLVMDLGKARFQVKELFEFETQEFKVQTKTAVVGMKKADVIIRVAENSTEVIALKNTQLELTSLKVPEEKILLSDSQRAIVENEKESIDVESMTPEEIGEILAEFRRSPEINLFNPTLTRFPKDDSSEEAITEDNEVEPDL